MSVDRRLFLKALGSTTAAAAFSRSIARALSIAANSKGGSIADVEHIVILMQENRSFDHYFGTLSGVRGFGDPRAMRLANGRSVFAQPDGDNPDSYLLPFHLDSSDSAAQAVPSLSHAWQIQHA